MHIDHPNPFYRAKAACEERLIASGMNYTILKPGMFMEVWIGAVVGIPFRSGLPVTLVGHGNRRHIFYVGTSDLEWGLEQAGNYWSDYLGWDQDGDGLGDRPYRIDNFTNSLVYRYPASAPR